MNTPAFTTDPQRISRLQANYEAGATRERMPAEKREHEECALLAPSAAHMQKLFAQTGAIQKARADAIQARKDQRTTGVAAA